MFDAGHHSYPENDEWCFLKVLENQGDPEAEEDELSLVFDLELKQILV